MRGIVIDLDRRFGPALLEKACRTAGASPTWRSLEALCQKMSEEGAPPDPGEPLCNGLQQEHHLIRSPGEYGNLVRRAAEARA